MDFRIFVPALAAFAAVCAAPVAAATFDIALTADPANLTTNNFSIGSNNYRTGQLFSDAFDAFTISEGDVIRTTLTLSGALTVPGSMEQLFGLNFYHGDYGSPLGYPEGEGPDTEGTLTFSYSMGPTGLTSDTLPGSCSNCLTLISGNIPGGDFVFDSLVIEQTITSLDAPFTIDNAQFTYQLRDVAGAIPEPSTWALTILGFGIVGAAMRRSRRTIRMAFA